MWQCTYHDQQIDGLIFVFSLINETSSDVIIHSRDQSHHWDEDEGQDSVTQRNTRLNNVFELWREFK